MEPIDTSNKYAVSIHGMRVIIQLPPLGSISHDDALNLAAWIVAITGKEKRFAQILKAVQDS